MRNPLNTMYITNPYLAKGYGVFGVHAGLDLRASVGTSVYAPGAGYVTESYVGSGGIQVLSARIDGKEHRFLHLSSRLLSVGQHFAEGQVIAKTGNSGNVAAHLHWDVRKAGTAWNSSINNYYNPSSVINESKAPTGGNEVANATQVNNLYKAILHREGDSGGIKNYTGRDANTIVSEFMGSAEFKAHTNFLSSVNKTIADQQSIIANLSKNPTKAQLDAALADMEILRSNLAAEKARADKVVEKVIEKEVIVEVEPTWLKTAVDFIRKVLRIGDK